MEQENCDVLSTLQLLLNDWTGDRLALKLNAELKESPFLPCGADDAEFWKGLSWKVHLLLLSSEQLCYDLKQ